MTNFLTPLKEKANSFLHPAPAAAVTTDAASAVAASLSKTPAPASSSSSVGLLGIVAAVLVAGWYFLIHKKGKGNRKSLKY